MLLKDQIGICIYNWYGAGGHQGGVALPLTIQGTELVNSSGKWVSTIKACASFKLHRAFVDNWIVTKEAAPPFTLSTNPTEQNFYFDEFFKLQKAHGITNIWSASGCFDWYKGALGSYSQRKTACYDPAKSPSDPAAWADLAELCRQIAAYYKDKNLLDYIQILNEWDFRWNVPRVITPEEYAVCFKTVYEAIRSVAPAQKIMAGCTLTPDLLTAKRFLTALDTLCANEGKPKIRDFVYTFNNYIRTESNNQGNGIGATAEEVDRYGVFFKPLEDYFTAEGVEGWACTESGWNTSPSTSASAMKNKAPALEGYTLEEAQGILAIRLALIMASLPKFKGVTFYHCKDGYEAEPFTYHGFNYDTNFGGKPDWSSKPGKIVIENFLAKYGSYTVERYTKVNGIHYAVMHPQDDKPRVILHWSDKVNTGTATPMPTETASIPTEPPPPPPPPTPTTMIIGYSTKADRSDFAQLTANANLPAGNYYIEARQATPTVSFTLKKDGIVVKTQNENGAPYDLAGGQPYNFTTGDYEITMKDKTTPAGLVITFTVGTVAPPPPPPPPAKEPVTETWIENGRVYFKTATKTYSTAVE